MSIDLGAILANYGPPVLRAAVIVMATKLAIHLLRQVLAGRAQSVPQPVVYSLPKVIWVLSIMIILGTFGIDTTSLLTLMATAGVGLALVFTPFGQNLIAGFLAGMDDTVREGDVLRVLDRDGRVSRRGPLSTGIDFPDGSRVYVPNVKETIVVH